MKSNKKYGIVIGVLIIVLAILAIVLTGSGYDPDYDKQWSLHDSVGINAESMWETANDNKQERKVVVAVIDTGVDFGNKELEDREWSGAQETDFGSTKEIESYHGTMCAEIIAADHNDYGIEGIANDIDLEIMDLHVLSAQNSVGGADIDSIIDAIQFAEKNGADICNMSFGTEIYSSELYDAMRDSEMLFVTSAGNASSFRGADLDEKPYYPASFDLDNILSVTCIDESGEYTKTANYGKQAVDATAPGIDIPVIQENGEIGTVSGASFAVPHAAGIASVLYAYDKNMNAYKCKRYICSTVQKRESLIDKCKTEGVVDGNAALELLIRAKKEGDAV